MLDDSGSGLDLPAAVIVEAVQGEGGINVASSAWLQRLRAITSARGILLIVDDIQAGVGRTGAFFSFEESGIVPDIVTVSKSISASGLPMSLVLMRREVDVWKPGAHTGTFRGNNLAFVTARVALDAYWADTRLRRRDRAQVRAAARARCSSHRRREPRARLRGARPRTHLRHRLDLAPRPRRQVAAEAFERGLVIETSGARDEVLKFLPALTITDAELQRGLAIVRESLAAVLAA